MGVTIELLGTTGLWGTIMLWDIFALWGVAPGCNTITASIPYIAKLFGCTC